MKCLKLLLFTIVVLLSSFIVSAKTNIAKDLIIKETSGNVYVETSLVNEDVITPIIGFGGEGASISYQFRLQFDTYLYNIDSIKDNNKNKSLKTNYSFKDDKVFMTMKYDDSVQDSSLKNYEITVKLKGKNVNPKSGIYKFLILLFFYLLLFILLIISLIKN